MSDRLSPLDAAFLEIEQVSPGSHMHVGWLLAFEPPAGGRAPTLAEVRADIDARLAAVPRFRSKLSSLRSDGLRFPQWVPCDDYDVKHHVWEETLPAPGGNAELWAWLGRYWSSRLDRYRPLWEMVLLGGLEGGRWGIATKTHHCLVDGVSGVQLTAALLDGPDGKPIDLPERPAPGDDALAPLHAVSGALRGVVDAAVHPRRTAEAIGALLHDELSAAPHTSLNVDVGGSRHYRSLRLPLADLKAVKNALGGSVNDVILAAVTSALRWYFLERGEPLPEHPLRAMVPVDVRGTGDHLALGNKVSTLFVELPIAEPDCFARYERIRHEATRLKEAGAAGMFAVVNDLTGLAPPALHAQLVHSAMSPRLYNLTVTNVPGSPVPLTSNGSRLRSIEPMVPIGDGHALGIAVVSYAGEVTFGLIADPDAVGDLDRFAAALESGLAELPALV